MASFGCRAAAVTIKVRTLRGEKQIHLETVMILSESTGNGIAVGESETGVGCILLERQILNIEVMSVTQTYLVMWTLQMEDLQRGLARLIQGGCY